MHLNLRCLLTVCFISFVAIVQGNERISIYDDIENKIILKDIQTKFLCNEKEYILNDLKFLEKSDKQVVSTLGKGICTTYRYLSNDKLEFGFEITNYDLSSWITVNAWMKNRSKKIVTFDAVNLIEDNRGPIFSGEWGKTRVLCGNTDKLVWLGEEASKGNTINARSFMCLSNDETNEEYVFGYSITQAWGSCTYQFQKGIPVFQATVRMDVDLKPDEKRYAEALHIKKGKIWGDFQELISATGKEVGARVDGKSFGGWCSWYGFNPFIDNDITEDVVVDFANRAGKIKDLPFELILLDDGYFTLPGDWTTLRPFFPHRMKYLTDQCKKNGLRPGVWVAATLVHEHSKIFHLKPEWVDKNKDGSYKHNQFNWGGKTHSFDATNKEFLHHIDTLFRYITHDWGFRYLKLDFNIEPGSNRVDRSITSFQAMRNFYKVINKAVGDSVFIANCAGTPYSPVIGYARAGRVGPDVNPNWASVLNGCRQSLLHIPFHRRWWVNDPDCLNMREKRSSLTESELQTHITANFLGGGYILFSDSLQELTPSRHQMLAKALPSYGKAAEIVDYMTPSKEGIPTLFYYPSTKLGDKSSIITLFNWSDEARNRIVDLEEVGLDKEKCYHVYDFWNDTYRGIYKENIDIKVQNAHSCLHLAVRPVTDKKIQIISTNFHLMQGEMEIKKISTMNTSPFDKAKAEMWIELSPVSLREGKIILKAENGLRIAAVQGGKAELIKRQDGLWNLNLRDMKDNVAVLLRVR